MRSVSQHGTTPAPPFSQRLTHSVSLTLSGNDGGEKTTGPEYNAIHQTAPRKRRLGQKRATKYWKSCSYMRSLIHTDGNISYRIASKHLILLINRSPSKNDPRDTESEDQKKKKMGKKWDGRKKQTDTACIYIYKMKKVRVCCRGGDSPEGGAGRDKH